MTKAEFSTWSMALKTFYPREPLLPNNQAMELWFRELQDIPFQVAEAALRKWVQTNKWSPSIADIREMAASVSLPEIPDWGAAWEQACKAIRRFGSYRQKDALDSLDPLCRKAVERLGYMQLCRSERPDMDRANFRMVYETLAKREQTEQQVALPLKETIGRLKLESTDGFLQLGGGENG